MINKDERLFAGAGVIVREPGNNAGETTATIVETEHAEQISELFFALKDIFANDIDYFNKYEFYGRLAKAANNQLVNGDDCDAVRVAIITEARAIATEIGKRLYFAYGANMDADRMACRCPKSLFVGTATLRNHEFALDATGAATVVEKADGQVYGALWLIADSDEQSLDGFEGVGKGCYRKATCEVIDDAGHAVPALVYISNRDMHDGATYRPGYMDNIIVNAKRLGFDAEYVDRLEAL